MKYAIETNSLTKNYGDFLAVDDLNMKIKNKSIFGFLGPNGAGKTTTIKMLTCLIKPTSGTGKVGGYDITTNPNEVRKKIGMVPQLVSLYNDLTAKENVELCADYYGLNEDQKEERIPELMELVDIKYAEDKLIKQMSGGQKQKVSVVASLIHKPDVLFLDEPTIGLDPTTKMVLWDLIAELNDHGHTIVLCSHDMYEVEMLCENVGIMNLGELAAFDTPQGLKDNLMHKNERELLKKMEGLSSIGDFSKTKTASEKIKSETFNSVNIEENNEADKEENISESISLEKFSAAMFNKDPDNHSPEYLAQIQKHSKEVSIMIKNINDNILEDVKKLDIVYHLTTNETTDGTRLTINVDRFAENSVSNVIWTIVKNDGNITSINTKDPSLEDVFVDVTSKKKVDNSNIQNMDD
ncbi:Vitamin B12 import ATP-binding protein BtuD [bioreactor metagenome]|uniref:Vitamin B12 import ATP-binding protein BtuD n=1 Tax=bioreactor metagenome TaxID=1076179 RepID=A0A644TWI3_9ZZZZ|nr:ATP-binding cassette domain-containing protein [Methanobrevibacter sp.]MEA4956593.1 ATP-binding cassette domain-containing protein [Methanobrevibacter sp.]